MGEKEVCLAEGEIVWKYGYLSHRCTEKYILEPAETAVQKCSGFFFLRRAEK